MKTWQAIVLSIGSIIGTAYASKIKDPIIRDAVLGSIAVTVGAGAHVNSNTDQNGNKI